MSEMSFVNELFFHVTELTVHVIFSFFYSEKIYPKVTTFKLDEPDMQDTAGEAGTNS